MNVFDEIATRAIPGWTSFCNRNEPMELSDKYETAVCIHQEARAILRKAIADLEALGDGPVTLDRIEAPSDLAAILGDYDYSDDYISACAEETEAAARQCARDEAADARREERALAMRD